VLDIYRTLDHPLGGDAFLYLAFTREASNGTVDVTFELNQDRRLWRNSQGTTIPCRTTGDILISFGAQGSGEAEVHAQRWETDSAASNGCARRGHLRAASLTSDDAQASYNNAAINNYLPGAKGATIAAREFGEAAINLSRVMADLGHPCGVFGSTWMHSARRFRTRRI